MKKFNKITEDLYNHPLYKLAKIQLEKEGKIDDGSIFPLEYTLMIIEKMSTIKTELENSKRHDFFKNYFTP